MARPPSARSYAMSPGCESRPNRSGACSMVSTRLGQDLRHALRITGCRCRLNPSLSHVALVADVVTEHFVECPLTPDKSDEEVQDLLGISVLGQDMGRECARQRLFVFLCSPDVERVRILLLTSLGDRLERGQGMP